MTYVTAAFFVFSFSILAASIALFLQERFEASSNSLIYVGALLGMASFFAIFIDTFWVYLQKIRPPKILLLYALVGLIITVAIFLFSHNLFVLTLIAALLYGWSFDLYDITLLTIILKRGKSKNYAQNISQKKLSEAIGMIFGLILSGFLLYFGSGFTQVVLLVILISVFIFALHHFDKEEDSHVGLEFSQDSLVNWRGVFSVLAHPSKIQRMLISAGTSVKKEVLLLSHETEEAIRNLPKNAQKKTGEILEASRKRLIEILAKENEIVKEKFPQPDFSFHDMWQSSLSIFHDFLRIFRKKDRKALIIWVATAVIFFSFWDTMAATFQPIFIQKITGDIPSLRGFSGVLLACFLLPILFFQVPFARLADKWGRENFVFLGVLVSGVSLLFLGASSNVWMIIGAGMANSVGYALAFSPAQAMLISEIEKTQKVVQKEHSSGMLRVALNIGNIFGQLGGGILFASLGFLMGFFIFGILLCLFSIFSFIFLLRRK